MKFVIFLECGGDEWYCLTSSCLYFSTRGFSQQKSFTWYEADELCSRKGATLLFIDNKEEEKNVTLALIELSVSFLNSTNTSETFFYGLTQTSSASTGVYSYGWSNGSPLLYIPFDSVTAFKGENLCGTLAFEYFNGSSAIHYQADP